MLSNRSPQENLTISCSPHIHAATDTRAIMLDVCAALLPVLVGAVYHFGMRALLLTAVSASACVFFEWAYRKLLKLDCTVTDGSAVVTGMLLALVCPVTLPIWTLLIGDFFAIVIVKQLFGGIGKNFMNPALAARAFLCSWAGLMGAGAFYPPGTRYRFFTGKAIDAVTEATPLAVMKDGSIASLKVVKLLFGRIGGCMGEVSVILILVGGIYLLARRVITLRIPLSYLLSVAVLTFLFPRGNDRVTWMLLQLCSGGLLLGAIFMATDYVTSPVTGWGQILYGIGCGALTVLIRYFGAYAEGATYAILIMNACSTLLDKVGRPRRFGAGKKGGARG